MVPPPTPYVHTAQRSSVVRRIWKQEKKTPTLTSYAGLAGRFFNCLERTGQNLTARQLELGMKTVRKYPVPNRIVFYI
jgi:hypothetical protein